MFSAAHLVIYTKDAEADRAFFRDVLGFPFVDAGEGWLIFAMPPSEAAFHPSDSDDRHELYLVTDDLETTMAELAERGVECTEPRDQGWGILTTLALPGGGSLGLYQPRHPLAVGPGSGATP